LQAKNVGQRVMIYDIECLTDGKRFPSAANSPIISITAYIVNIDDKLKLGKQRCAAAPHILLMFFFIFSLLCDATA
jgi:hypothetical protein